MNGIKDTTAEIPQQVTRYHNPPTKPHVKIKLQQFLARPEVKQHLRQGFISVFAWSSKKTCASLRTQCRGCGLSLGG